MFETIYESPWHHPAVAWAAALMVTSLAAALRRRWLGFLLLLECALALDAWLTGGWPPLAPSSRWAERAAVAFVVLGDWRFFFLVERQWRDRAGAAAISLMWSLVIPALSYVTKLLWPAAMADSHRLFFVYEVSFIGIASLTWFRARRRVTDGAVAHWIVLLIGFEVIQYAGWALADVLILRGCDFGFALRIVPNVLYYAAFVPFAVFSAPREARV